MRYRLSVSIRRAIAFWIDGFAVGAVILIAQWLINFAAGSPLVGNAATLYQIWAFALVFFTYRLITEGRWNTSLGKWSLSLEIIALHPGYQSAALRNSWILLTLLAAWGVPHVETTIFLVFGLCMLGLAQHPFDFLAKTMIERKPGDN